MIDKEKIEKTEQLRQQFVSYYTREFIKGMTIKQYAMGTGKKDNFCYRLEREQEGMGRITSAQAGVRRYGVWYNKDIGGYDHAKRYGPTVNLAFVKVKKQILALIDAGERDDYQAIRDNMFSPLVRYKLLAMYFPYKYLTVYTHMSYFCDKAGIPAVDGDDDLVMQRKLIQWKDSLEETRDLSLLEYVAYLYDHFGHPKDDVKPREKASLKDLKAALKDFDGKHPAKTLTEVERTQRSALVSSYVKERAGGVCQLCGNPAPFYTRNGDPYLECHHIIWIAKGGADEPSNAVALCPNCHRKMHTLDETADVERLKEIAKK